MVPQLEHFVSPNGRVILIGDAAHGMPPTAGQGAGSAIEDAATLAIALSMDPEFPSQPTTDRLSKWESHRMDRLKVFKDLITRIDAVWKPESSPWRQWIKEWVVWLAYVTLNQQKEPLQAYIYRVEDIIPLLRPKI